jgi:hypothetical protein
VQATTQQQIRSRRDSSTPPKLRAKYGAGQDAGVGRAFVRVGKSQSDVLTGQDDLSSWDMEELRQGRKRSAKTGTFVGRGPVVVAKAVHDELVKRTLDAANKLLIENLEEAVKVLGDIMKDTTADNKDRLTAIKMISDRAMGKEPMTINVGQEAKWQTAITHSIVSMPAALVDPDINNRDEGDEDGTTGD